ncbi:ABC transporter ATP-binding protein [Bdellovibrio sp.]|uniref:ABC transporter ATP-binding protein n=1 Tax=Bdellovibrio sp. TaxID=28201 RepID=UPI0039E5C3AD
MYEIELNNVGLKYDLYYDKTTNLKEFLINFLKRKRTNLPLKENKLAALSNINLHLKEGDRVGIIGPNGAGKSTLLKIISGVLHPTSGTINVKGNIQPLIEVGAGFNPEFSGRENIYLNGYMLGFSKKQITRKEKEIIEFSELGEFIDVPIKYYSSGMSVRLAFAIATSIEPEILVFDEMLSAGDLHFMEKAKKRMNTLLEMAKILVFVSHDLKLVENLCKEVIVVSKGQIVFRGRPDEAIEYYRTRFS